MFGSFLARRLRAHPVPHRGDDARGADGPGYFFSQPGRGRAADPTLDIEPRADLRRVADPPAHLERHAGVDLIINTVNVDLDWQPYFEALAYGGNFHTVGAVLKPLPVPAFTLIGGDRSVSGSATGTPFELRKLMKFAGRTKVSPTTELYPMSKINEAIQHVRDGKARYRVVLKADF